MTGLSVVAELHPENRAPDPVDRHVGYRLASLRKRRGFSQSDLGRCLGLSFQQIQKYETGANRISSSRLWAAAMALDVRVDDFFDGLGASPTPFERPSKTVESLDREAVQLDAEDQKLMLLIARRLARKAREG
ncbi:hypothetical protein GCM10009422_25860 [Brevundimonas kwangchunensis]|uniref:HTH cro/C1-type domain-containing protein n=1 Tax=Brevundimonas kwangchunensis TaxID=322163 RepID=A0ABN1H308_9CAUL